MPFQVLRNSRESGDRRLLLWTALLGGGWITVSAWCVYALCGLPSSLASQPRAASAVPVAVQRAGAGVVVALVDSGEACRHCDCDRPIR